MYCSLAREHQRLSKAFQRFSGTGQATDNRSSRFLYALLYSDALNREQSGCFAIPLVSTVSCDLKTQLGLLLEIARLHRRYCRPQQCLRTPDGVSWSRIGLVKPRTSLLIANGWSPAPAVMLDANAMS